MFGADVMVKDWLFKWMFIPLAGFLFPFLAGVINVSTPMATIALTVVGYMGLVFVLWHAVLKLITVIRIQKRLRNAVFLKLVFLVVPSAVFSATVSALFTWAWQQVVLKDLLTDAVQNAALTGGIGGMLLALLYEVVFLSVEKELDNRVLQQIDLERLEAEVSVLKSELDPHFFFNCMNTLSYLVRNDAEKAWQFVHRLSNVYKYFLRNKEKRFVSLQEEMAFLDNYHFLLRIRFDDNIRIEHSIEPHHGNIAILPCTLQVLVENAMKHNFFSEKEPLVISIVPNGHYISVSNPVRPKLNAAESTQIGLRNLKARYRIITNQNVLIQKTATRFLVKLPILKTSQHDKSSDH